MSVLRNLILAGLLFVSSLSAAEPWADALARMPLQAGVRQLNRTNCVDVMVRAFTSNGTVRALVFMPGATDEFYFFRRARAGLTNGAPTLLDAVAALTNQTYLRATWRPPLLLLHTQEDSTEPLTKIENARTAAKLKAEVRFAGGLFNDRDWDHLLPVLRKQLKVSFRPWEGSFAANHFYRHSFAAWNLTGWEALEAVALAGKTKFTVQSGRVVFEGDDRMSAPPPGIPTLETFDRLFPQVRPSASAK